MCLVSELSFLSLLELSWTQYMAVNVEPLKEEETEEQIEK